MRILILCSKFPYPLKDGGAIATNQLYFGIKKKAEQVYLLSFNTSKHHVREEDIRKSGIPLNDISLVNINTKPTLLGLFINLLTSRKPYILSRFTSKNYSRKLIDILQNNQFDIVQIEGLYMLQYLSDIRNHSNAKIAFRAHNLEFEIWKLLAKNCNNWFKKKYFKNLTKRVFSYEKKMLNKYDLLLPISEDDANTYHELGNKKPQLTVPTGMDFNATTPIEISGNKNNIFYVGSLEWLPNQEGLVWFIDNCWSEIIKLKSDLELYIAGRNAPEWLKKKLSLPGIIWEGEIESINDFIKDKSVMIVPLFSGSGLRIKIIEAFTNGKAVVATSIAVKGTGATDGVNIQIADKPEEFIKKLFMFIENDEFYKRVCTNAYLYAKKHFNNNIIVEKLYNFYGLYCSK